MKKKRPRRHTKQTLLARTKKTPEGCWQWLGAKDKKGYGYVGIDGKSRRVHRVFYVLFKGPIPEGLTLDHLCRNPGCANPDHLEPVTLSENAKRGQAFLNKDRTHCIRGHEYTEENTQRTRNGGRACHACQRLKYRLKMEKLRSPK